MKRCPSGSWLAKSPPSFSELGQECIADSAVGEIELEAGGRRRHRDAAGGERAFQGGEPLAERGVGKPEEVCDLAAAVAGKRERGNSLQRWRQLLEDGIDRRVIDGSLRRFALPAGLAPRAAGGGSRRESRAVADDARKPTAVGGVAQIRTTGGHSIEQRVLQQILGLVSAAAVPARKPQQFAIGRRRQLSHRLM